MQSMRGIRMAVLTETMAFLPRNPHRSLPCRFERTTTQVIANESTCIQEQQNVFPEESHSRQLRKFDFESARLHRTADFLEFP